MLATEKCSIWLLIVTLCVYACGCSSVLEDVPAQKLSRALPVVQSDKVFEYKNELGFVGGGVRLRESSKTDANYRIVRVYFRTNREPSNEPGVYFGGRLSNQLYNGVAEVSIPAEHRMGRIERPSIWRLEFSPNPKRHIIFRKAHRLTTDAFLKQLRARTGAVLLFVHGFNTSFEMAAMRAAQLHYDLAFPGATVFFSWPSKNRALSYLADRTQMRNSILALRDTIEEVRTSAGTNRLIIVAHSMGADLATEAIAQLKPGASRNKNLDLILAAPDIDRRYFVSELMPKISRLTNTTIYASENDQALNLSSNIHEAPRLGNPPPDPRTLDQVEFIDASRLKTSFVGHSYYGDQTNIISDMFYIVHRGLPAEKRAALVKVGQQGRHYWRFR